MTWWQGGHSEAVIGCARPGLGPRGDDGSGAGKIDGGADSGLGNETHSFEVSQKGSKLIYQFKPWTLLEELPVRLMR